MLTVLLNESKLISKSRDIKNYKSNSKDKRNTQLSEPNPKIEEIRRKLINQEISFISEK